MARLLYKPAADPSPEPEEAVDRTQYGRIYNVAPVVDEDAPEGVDEPTGPFDPSEHNADDVKAHLDGADRAEFDRVLALEAEGKQRKGILELTPPEDDEVVDEDEPEA